MGWLLDTSLMNPTLENSLGTYIFTHKIDENTMMDFKFDVFILQKNVITWMLRFPDNADLILRYVRDRISVPRDMGIWAAKILRTALEDTASTWLHCQLKKYQ